MTNVLNPNVGQPFGEPLAVSLNANAQSFMVPFKEPAEDPPAVMSDKGKEPIAS